MTNQNNQALGIAATILLCSHAALAADLPTGPEYVNSIGIKLVRIEPGTFMMGFGSEPLADELSVTHDNGSPRKALRHGNYDEHPTHKVTITKPFYIGAFEITNAQYERYDPKHRLFRPTADRSWSDTDPVAMVSWHDAVAFCKWLSEKHALPYRLPTEAEWEYACRAGTDTPFYTGNSLPDANTPPNNWHLFDCHGSLQEWCCDWYGSYHDRHHTDPVGPADGDFKLTRGGSYYGAKFYLRSANRAATIADDKSPLIGFRVVLGEMPTTTPWAPVKPPYQQNVSQTIPPNLTHQPDPDSTSFEIRRYINIDEGAEGPLYYYHNHNPDIIQCPNGDLLAIHFSTRSEGDREMVYGASRLRCGHTTWDKTSLFWAPPDRKAEYSVLWVDADTIYNFSSLGIANSRPSAIVMRYSKDNAATWSKPRTIVERADDQGVMQTVFRTSGGAVVIPADDHNLFISLDNTRTWFSPCGGNGPAGIHTPIIELKNHTLMSFGRYGEIDGKMPKSLSQNLGRTWTHTAGVFTGIGGGQRATMMRLKQGPIFFASFAKNMIMTDGCGEKSTCSGLFAALSFDEGLTWPVIRLISDGSGRKVLTRKNKYYQMTKNRSESNGYLASCQSADGVIHIVSNRVEYAFNLKWLRPDRRPP